MVALDNLAVNGRRGVPTGDVGWGETSSCLVRGNLVASAVDLVRATHAHVATDRTHRDVERNVGRHAVVADA